MCVVGRTAAIPIEIETPATGSSESAVVLETLDEDPVFDGGRVIGESFEITTILQKDE